MRSFILGASRGRLPVLELQLPRPAAPSAACSAAPSRSCARARGARGPAWPPGAPPPPRRRGPVWGPRRGLRVSRCARAWRAARPHRSSTRIRAATSAAARRKIPRAAWRPCRTDYPPGKNQRLGHAVYVVSS